MVEDLLERLKSALAGRYTVERELGRGGMATVYLAEDCKHARKVAVKVLRPELAAVLGAERFLNEIKVTANLNHPHILPLHDSGEADGFLYYVMPFVEGESLRTRLQRERQLPIEDAVKIALEVADALGYAHSHGVVHRDIKPENILLESGHATVMDFGVARAISAAGDERLTETGLVVGTPAYLSPEQAAGDRELDGRSDVYTLGCVLHEMLTGEPPITGPSVAAILARKSTESPRSTRAIRDTVPPELDRTIRRALALVPADRQRTATQLAEELSALGGRDRTGRARPGRRRPLWIGVAVAAVAIAVAVVVRGPLASGGSSVAAAAANQVMVLPYENRTGDEALGPVGQMVAEWITEGLARTGEVQVVPNFMVLQAVAQARDAEGVLALGRVAELTASGIVVTGSYYRREDDLEFHTEVVDLASGTPFATVDPVWGSADDPRRAIDSVRIQVMGALATRLSRVTGWELPPTAQPPTYEASQAYGRGLEEWARSEYRAAARWFERAYALDTTYLRSLMLAAAAHGNVGERAQQDSLLHLLLGRQDELAPYDRYRLEYLTASHRGDRAAALAAAHSGVELLPYGTLRYALVGELLSANRPHEALQHLEDLISHQPIGRRWYRVWQLHTEILHVLGDHERELALAREAREVVSGPLYAMGYEGRALAALGRLEELTALVGEIVVAAPQPMQTPGEALMDLAREARAHGYHAAALEIAQRALVWHDEQPEEFKAAIAGRELLGRLLYLCGDWDEAGGVFAALAADSAEVLDALGYQGAIAARRGDAERARGFASELAALQMPRLRGTNTLRRARIAAILGRQEEAVTLLQKGFGEGLDYGIWLHRDMDLESLHGFPPFQELMRPKG